MEKTFTVFVDLDGASLTVNPRNVTKEQALAQMDSVNKHMMQFPGGTQSIRMWMEETI